MSSEWQILRDDVLIADLATTDLDMTGLQIEPTPPIMIKFVAPLVKYPDSGNNTNEWAFVVHAYNDAGTYIAGAADVKVVERSDYQGTPPPGEAQKKHYVGDTTKAAWPLGDRFLYAARKLNSVTVKLANVTAVGATKVRVLYRQLR